MSNKLIIVIAVTLAISGCATRTAEFYRDTPTAKLCMDYLTLPSYNINHEARAQALAARGESCAAYTGVARSRIEADNAFQNTLNAMQQQGTPQQPQNPPQGTRMYNINGRMTTCTTTGNITNCN